MKSIGTLLLLVASSFAYDAVIFSSTTKITYVYLLTILVSLLFVILIVTLQNKLFQERCSGCGIDNGLSLIRLSPCVLRQSWFRARTVLQGCRCLFRQLYQVNIYIVIVCLQTKKSDSSIVNAAKAAKYAESRFISSVIHAPSSSRVSISSPLEKGQSIYLVSAENWSSLDKLAAEVMAVLGDRATVIVTNTDAVSTDAVSYSPFFTSFSLYLYLFSRNISCKIHKCN